MEPYSRDLLDRWIKKRTKFIPLLEGLNGADFTLLYLLNNYLEENNINYAYVSKLSELNQVSLPAISKQLNKLESQKYIKRTIDLFNRRNTKVMITEKGLAILRQNEETVLDFIKKIIERCGQESVDTFSYVLETISQELKGGDSACLN